MEERWYAAGTVLVKDLFPGIGPSTFPNSSFPRNLININGILYFTTRTSTNNSTYGRQLWKSDGTTAGTVLVKDAMVGSSEFSSPNNLTNVNGVLYFSIHKGTSGVELWKSNGSVAGTVLIKTIFAPNETFDPTPVSSFTASNGKLYFIATTAKGAPSYEEITYLWKSDGSAAGTIIVNAAPAGTATGNILREYWANVTGTAVSAIPVNTTPTSTSQLTSFETPSNIGDNYGQRVRGYICAPSTGNYTFYIAGDDNSELWLSTDDNAANEQRIAHISGAGSWATARQWTKFASQKSAVMSLVAGKKYYIEALQKEGVGGDNLAVGWTLPNTSTITVIPGAQLSPFVPATNTVSVPFRINSGGPTVVADGITFYEDKYFSAPSATSLHQKEVANTNRDIMYVDYRHSTNDGGSFSYNIPLANGTYIIHLNFAEVYHTASGRRVFSVNLEGGTVELPNFDVFAAAGFSTAITKIYTVTVSDGMLNVDFTSQVGKAMIGALQVLPASSARLAADEDVPASNMAAYPNPFADKLTVALAGVEGKVVVTLTDVVGKQHYSITKQVSAAQEQLELDLSGLKTGVYLIKLQNENGTSKLVRVVKK